MKKLLLYCTLLFIVSCSSNHTHDGKYSIEENGQNYGNIIISGNEIIVKVNPELLEGRNDERKEKCRQYPDRIEFENDGTIIVGRFDKSGNLDMFGYLFKKVSDKEKTNPVVVNNKINEKKPIKKLNDKVAPVLLSPNPQIDLVSPIKTHSEESFSYDYVEKVKPDISETFFQGTKNFDGHIDDVYTLTIKGDNIKIMAPQDGNNNVIFQGSIKDGEILDNSGAPSKFVFIVPYLYYKNSSKEWFVFYEFN